MDQFTISNQEKKHIFLSYRSSQVDFALRLAVDLKNAGVNLWMDRLDIVPGDDWLKSLQKAVNDCSAMITVLSPEYVKSKYCQRELARADRLERIVFPVLLFPIPEDEWPLEMERRQYIDFTEWHNEKVYKAQVKQLIGNLRDRLADQVFAVPDPETRYTNTLIANLEADRGTFEYFAYSSQTFNTYGEAVIRPQPIFIKTWNLPGRYTLVDSGDSQPSLDATKVAMLTSIYEVIESHPLLVLLGTPGSGKTTTLEHLVLDAAHLYRKAPKVSPLPLYLRLVDWGDEATPAEFIRANWTLESDVIKLLAKGKVALFLDGLSEMGEASEKKAKQLRKWLQGANGPQRVIVTCREDDYDARLDLGIPALKTTDLDRSHIQQFAMSYLAENDAIDFVSQLRFDQDSAHPPTPRLSELARNPLMLCALIVMYDLSPTHELPANRGGLMQNLVTRLWDHGKAHSGDIDESTFKRLEEGLADLALGMLDADTSIFVTLEYALDFVGSYFLLNAAFNATLLESHGQFVRFSNQLIQEYFAALGLMRGDFASRLTKPAFDSSFERIPTRWDRVVHVLVGLMPNPDETILKIAAIDPYLALDCTLRAAAVSAETYDAVVKLLVGSMEGDRRVAMASILIGCADDKAAFILLEVMRDGSWSVRRAANEVFNRISSVPMPGLTQAIDSLEDKTRESTITALRQLGQAVTPTLLELMKDANWHRRRGAAWACGEIHEKAAVPRLSDLLSDSDQLVVAEAVIALGRIKDPVVVPALIPLLGHENWRIGKAAARSIAAMGKSSLESLLEILDSPSSDSRQKIHAIDALSHINDEKAGHALLNATYAQAAEVRSVAIDSLRYQWNNAGVKRLIDCLSDTTRPRQAKHRICDVAAETLTSIGTPEALEAVANWRKQAGRVPPGESEGSKARSKVKDRLKRDKDRQHVAVSPDGQDVNTGLLDPDWQVRRDAVLALGAALPSVAAPQLIRALRDEDTQVRLSAINVLTVMKDEVGVIPALIHSLGDEEYLVSDAAREALKKIVKPPLAELRNIVHSSDINVRGAAIDILGHIKDEDATQDIIDCLADMSRPWLSDQRICDIAAEALESIGTADALEAVKQWKESFKIPLPEPPEAGDDVAQVDILSDLITALHDEDWETKQNAAKSLREYALVIRGSPEPAILDRLAALMSDEDVHVRWAITEALAWLGDHSMIPSLIKLLNDENWTVRTAAIRALAEMGDLVAVDGIINLLTDKNEMVRETAAEALGNLGDQRAGSGLLKAIFDSELFVRLAAIDALGKIKEPKAVKPLVKLLKHDDVVIRWFCAVALGRIGDDDAVPDLILALEDTMGVSWDDKRVCDVAAEALELIGTDEAKAAVSEWQLNEVK